MCYNEDFGFNSLEPHQVLIRSCGSGFYILDRKLVTLKSLKTNHYIKSTHKYVGSFDIASWKKTGKYLNCIFDGDDEKLLKFIGSYSGQVECLELEYPHFSINDIVVLCAIFGINASVNDSASKECQIIVLPCGSESKTIHKFMKKGKSVILTKNHESEKFWLINCLALVKYFLDGGQLREHWEECKFASSELFDYIDYSMETLIYGRHIESLVDEDQKREAICDIKNMLIKHYEHGYIDFAKAYIYVSEEIGYEVKEVKYGRKTFKTQEPYKQYGFFISNYRIPGKAHVGVVKKPEMQ